MVVYFWVLWVVLKNKNQATKSLLLALVLLPTEKQMMIILAVSHSHKPGNKLHFEQTELWFHRKEHTYSFDLAPKLSSYYSYFFEIWPFVYETLKGFSGRVIWEISL